MERANTFKKQLAKFTNDEPFNAVVNNAYNIRAYIKDTSVATGETTIFIYTKDTMCRRGDIITKHNRNYLVTHVKYIESKGYDAVAATLMEGYLFINVDQGTFALPYLSTVSATLGVIGTYITNSESQAIIQVSTRHRNFGALSIGAYIFVGSVKYQVGFIDTSVDGLATIVTKKALYALGDDISIGVHNRSRGEVAWPNWQTAIAEGPYITLDEPTTLTPVSAEGPNLAEPAFYHFETDRPEVAMVNQYGTIIPISDGVARIRVASVDEGGIPLAWDETRIVSQLKPLEPGEIIAITEGHEFIDEGETFTIICRTTDSEGVQIQDSYEYEPSNPAVCMVDDYGEVTALSEGYCDIIVTSKRFPSLSTTVSMKVAYVEIIEWKVEVASGTNSTVALMNESGKVFTIQKYRNSVPVDSGHFSFKVTGQTSGFKDFARVSDNSFKISGQTVGYTVNVACTNVAEPYSVNVPITVIYTN